MAYITYKIHKTTKLKLNFLILMNKECRAKSIPSDTFIELNHSIHSILKLILILINCMQLLCLFNVTWNDRSIQNSNSLTVQHLFAAYIKHEYFHNNGEWQSTIFNNNFFILNHRINKMKIEDAEIHMYEYWINLIKGLVVWLKSILSIFVYFTIFG